MDRFELLEWLIEGERRDPAFAPDGTQLLSELGRTGAEWPTIAGAAGELLALGWVTARWMRRPGALREPDPELLTVYELQEFTRFRVTDKGYAMHSDRNPPPAGPTFNITNSQVGQLAAGDINNITIETLLLGIEKSIDDVEGSPEDKAAARETVGKMRQLIAGVGTSAAGGVLSAAARAALGLP